MICSLAVLLAIPALFLCFGAQSAEAAGISISKTSATISKEESVTLHVTKDGSTVSGAVWGSSDPSVATVDSAGKVTGVLKGSAVISAMYEGATVECLVSVVDKATSKMVRYNVLVLDRSGSMRGTPMKQTKKAAKRFAKTVMNADGTNYVAVVTLGSKSSVVCGFTTSYSKVSKAIGRISAVGHTNMRASFEDARKLLDQAPSGSKVIKNPETGKKKTSGRYRSKDHKDYKFANSVYTLDKKLKKKGYFIYALGFFHKSSGKDLKFGKRLMKDLASRDKYFVITDSKDLKKKFDDIADQIISLTLSETSITLKVGEKRSLTAYLNGIKNAAKWSSDDASTASVSSKGVVTGAKVGTTYVRARAEGRTVKCKVKVINSGAKTKITLNKKKITIYVGDKKTLKATVTGKSGTITWSSSNRSIATVSGSGTKGKVTGVKTGTCKVTATCNGVSATCTVVVKPKDITGDFLLFGDAKRLDDGSIRLTENYTWKSGSAWYPNPINTSDNMTISFDYWAGGGRSEDGQGADGIVLNLSEKTGLGGQGEEMGFAGYYGVELDSYPFNSGDPDERHIAIVKDDIHNHLKYVFDDRTDDSKWHTMKIIYKSGTLTVYVDGKNVLSLSGVTLKAKTYLGLSAATGGSRNEQKIRNFKIR